jgi:lipopolysaccharide transport system ATP-binding protein
MNNVVISVEKLSKKYIIAHEKAKAEDAPLGLAKVNRSPWGWLKERRRARKLTREEFWALRDVSFEVRRGDTLGIIGKNGAGKSTLLKILSRITEPTQGRLCISGRLASLLEVGTGFHPELTGRENIYLNGAILGMSRSELKRKFDAIVAFAEVERFLDTPVKRYSSGMYVRLAFAVAANLEPELLVVDEVLAVGDTVFQKKCIDRMADVSRQGRTVIFVTHNVAALTALCRRTIVLQAGEKKFDGDTKEAIRYYMPVMTSGGSEVDLSASPRTAGEQELVFQKAILRGTPFQFGQPIRMSFFLHSRIAGKQFSELDIGLGIRDRDGNYVIHCSNRFVDFKLTHESDTQEYSVEIESILKPNVYYVTLFLRSKEIVQDWLTDAISFEVSDGNPYGYYSTAQIQGSILPRFTFHVQ